MCKTLAKGYARKTSMSKILLKAKVVELRMAEGTELHAHIDHFQSFCVELQKFENDFSGESKTIILLISLPIKYENLLTTMFHGMKMPSLDEAISTLNRSNLHLMVKVSSCKAGKKKVGLGRRRKGDPSRGPTGLKTRNATSVMKRGT